jgi:hypothetical protein
MSSGPIRWPSARRCSDAAPDRPPRTGWHAGLCRQGNGQSGQLEASRAHRCPDRRTAARHRRLRRQLAGHPPDWTVIPAAATSPLLFWQPRRQRHRRQHIDVPRHRRGAWPSRRGARRPDQPARPRRPRPRAGTRCRHRRGQQWRWRHFRSPAAGCACPNSRQGWRTPQQFSFEHAALSFGLGYALAADDMSFRNALRHALDAGGPRLIELRLS